MNRRVRTKRSKYARRAFAGALAACALTAGRAQAEDAPPRSYPFALPGEYNEIESKYIFGFLDGADIGLEGEKAIESETNAAWRRRQGRYLAIEQELAFEHVLTQNFAYEFAVHGTAHRVKGDETLADKAIVRASGLSAKFNYLLLGRGPESPVGLTVSAEPEWSRVDGTQGAATRSLGVQFKVRADTELIANRLLAAINLSYAPEVEKAVGDLAWQRSTTLGVAGALAWRVTPKVTIGGAGEYFLAYDSLGFGAFQGRSFYLGPTLHIQIARKILMAAAFSTQVAGHALTDDRRLDLTNFSRHRARLKFEYEF